MAEIRVTIVNLGYEDAGELILSPTDTILQVMEKIKEKGWDNWPYCWLTYKGNELERDQTLAQIGIVDGEKLCMGGGLE